MIYIWYNVYDIYNMIYIWYNVYDIYIMIYIYDIYKYDIIYMI